MQFSSFSKILEILEKEKLCTPAAAAVIRILIDEGVGK